MSIKTAVEKSWRRIDKWLVNNVPEVFQALNTGATEQEIKDTETALGIVFPEDFRASYRIHNGQKPDAPGASDGFGLLNATEFFSLARMTEDWAVWKKVLDDGHFVRLKSEPLGPIRTDWWNSGWIPLTSNGSADSFCLDMNPAPGGRVGQIITMWNDQAEREVIAGSFAEWLEQFAEDLEVGEYVTSDNYGGIVRREDAEDDV